MTDKATLIDLWYLLTEVSDFEKIFEMTSRGDHTKVDMMVKDIYRENSPFNI